jgi:hypothetical protein
VRKRKGKKEGAGEKGVVVVELGKENSRDGKEDVQEPLQQTVQTCQRRFSRLSVRGGWFTRSCR